MKEGASENQEKDDVIQSKRKQKRERESSKFENFDFFK